MESKSCDKGFNETRCVEHLGSFLTTVDKLSIVAYYCWNFTLEWTINVCIHEIIMHPLPLNWLRCWPHHVVNQIHFTPSKCGPLFGSSFDRLFRHIEWDTADPLDWGTTGSAFSPRNWHRKNRKWWRANTQIKCSVLGERRHICFQHSELFWFGSRYLSKVS